MISILMLIRMISLVEVLVLINCFVLQELGSLQEYLLALNSEDHLHRCTAQVITRLHNPRDAFL